MEDGRARGEAIEGALGPGERAHQTIGRKPAGQVSKKRYIHMYPWAYWTLSDRSMVWVTA